MTKTKYSFLIFQEKLCINSHLNIMQPYQ